ncbi:preprotein translocase subunit YajC [Actinoplanes sp. NPDC049668]|uniref:preprotein translocase subunit YajC n=1 Tax=unclassified Actinoplanes TaxID=2626549 RepID=UPI0033BB4117
MFIAAQAQGGGSFMPLLLIVLLFGVMYFMMIRPQQKRRREAQQMQSALGPGDDIVTIGGLHATVVSVDDDVVTVEIAPGVNARYARPAIARVVQSASDVVPEPVDEPAEETPAETQIESPVVETRKSKD